MLAYRIPKAWEPRETSASFPNLMDGEPKASKDRARAERLAQLKRPSETYRTIGDAVGVIERTVAEWFAGGNIGRRNLGALAEHWGVTPEYIEYGHERPAPDLFPHTDADRLLERLDELDRTLVELRAAVAKNTTVIAALKKQRAADLKEILRGIEDYTQRLGREVGKRPPRSRRATDPPPEARSKHG